jgi:hypothetical protein
MPAPSHNKARLFRPAKLQAGFLLTGLVELPARDALQKGLAGNFRVLSRLPPGPVDARRLRHAGHAGLHARP